MGRRGATKDQVREGQPNPETRTERDLCPYCSKGYKTEKDYLRANCDATGFPHNSPEHIAKTKEIELRGKSQGGKS